MRAAMTRVPRAVCVEGYRVGALRRAMEAHRGASLSFAATDYEPFENWLFPPSPFAAVLREAYAPHLPSEPYWTNPLWDRWGADQRLLAEH